MMTKRKRNRVPREQRKSLRGRIIGVKTNVGDPMPHGSMNTTDKVVRVGK